MQIIDLHFYTSQGLHGPGCWHLSQSLIPPESTHGVDNPRMQPARTCTPPAECKIKMSAKMKEKLKVSKKRPFKSENDTPKTTKKKKNSQSLGSERWVFLWLLIMLFWSLLWVGKVEVSNSRGFQRGAVNENCFKPFPEVSDFHLKTDSNHCVLHHTRSASDRPLVTTLSTGKFRVNSTVDAC